MDTYAMDLSGGKSLYWTVSDAARHLFFGGRFKSGDRDELAAWVLAHQNRRRGFSFYPTAVERELGVRLPSGEKPRTMLAADNAVEMETLRLLALLRPDDVEVRLLFERAERRLSGVCYGRVCPVGECAHASISVLRYHAARDAARSAGMIARGLETLRQARIGEGQWRYFPFYYTLLWLTELPEGLDERAHAELSYAQDRCRWLLSRSRPGTSGEPFEEVRAKILRDALARGGGTAYAQSPMYETNGAGILQTISLAIG
jgi:hypothetical protein